MKKRTIAAMLIMGLGVSGVLGACGTSDGDDAAGTSAEVNVTKEDDAEDTSAEANAAEEDDAQESVEEVTISVFDAQAYGIEEYAELAAAFEDGHPGVTVEIQHAANDNGPLLQSRFNSGDIPDVFVVETGTGAAEYYEYAYEWTEDADTLALFKEDAVEMCKDDEGNVKGLPWSYQNMGLIYNKDCFEAAGIEELPTSIDELHVACEKLDAAGITPIALAAKEGWVLTQLATHFMLDKELGANGTNEALLSGELTFEEMEHWDNLFGFLDLAKEYGPDKPLEVDWEASENMLANGEAAIIHMGDWCQATLDSFNPDANLAFLPVPVGEGEADSTLLSCCNWVYMVNKDSENLELAKEYVEYILTSEEGVDWTCQAVGAAPAAISDKEVNGDLANDAYSYITAGKTDGWIHTIAPSGFSAALSESMQGYLIDEMTRDQVTEIAREAYILK